MAKKTKVDKLTPFQEQFVDTWFNMNFNGRLAYKQLKPNVTNETATVEASKLLTLPNVENYIEIKREQLRMKEEVKLSFIISQLQNIIFELAPMTPVEYDADGKVVTKKDYKALLGALDQLTKIGGYNAPKKVDVTTNGNDLGEITINIVKPSTE